MIGLTKHTTQEFCRDLNPFAVMDINTPRPCLIELIKYSTFFSCKLKGEAVDM